MKRKLSTVTIKFVGVGDYDINGNKRKSIKRKQERRNLLGQDSLYSQRKKLIGDYLYLVGGYHSIDSGCPPWGTANYA
ncbi:MAG: hypothetical protein ACOX3J_14270 [Clostridia bacterium]